MGGICAKDESASSAVAPQYASDVEYRFARIIREQETLFNHLPVAELQSANVIKIVGHVGVFNTAPLADEGWLQGRMTNQEYVSLLTVIRSVVICSLITVSPGLVWRRSQLMNITFGGGAAVTFIKRLRQWWIDHRGIDITVVMRPPENLYCKLTKYPTDLFLTLLDRPNGMQLATPSTPAAAAADVNPSVSSNHVPPPPGYSPAPPIAFGRDPNDPDQPAGL